MEQFSAQWFTAYYLSLGALLLSYGIYLLLKTVPVRDYILEISGDPQAPLLLRRVLKYLLLFALPGLFLSFFPFSWVELIFSLWSLFVIFIGGQLLLIWPQTSKMIRENSELIRGKVRFAAANLITIGIILFMLTYLLLERTRIS
ncbi:MAG: hypothetical protein EA360_06900 [Balneolaceae bacterium]|nr:MAG: hypothetical protein EA360_06900 [Balneolaceae bacterium]